MKPFPEMENKLHFAEGLVVDMAPGTGSAVGTGDCSSLRCWLQVRNVQLKKNALKLAPIIGMTLFHLLL